MTGRRHLTRGQKRDLIFVQNGVCPECGERINLARGDEIEADHVIPLGIGGTNDMSNFQAIHAECHARKTKTDKTQIAKAKRVARKHDGSWPKSKRPLPGGKGAKLKRKVGGKVVARKDVNEVKS